MEAFYVPEIRASSLESSIAVSGLKFKNIYVNLYFNLYDWLIFFFQIIVRHSRVVKYKKIYTKNEDKY